MSEITAKIVAISISKEKGQRKHNIPEAELITDFGMKGDAAWAWLVNLDHLYFVNKCLDIGPRQIEPHGHGYPLTWNMQDWARTG